MTFRPDEPLSILGDPLFRIVGDEVFILMPDSQVHWLRNASARFVWESLRAAGAPGKSPAQLAAEIAQEFEVTSETALGDVLLFVAELASKRLIARAASV